MDVGVDQVAAIRPLIVELEAARNDSDVNPFTSLTVSRDVDLCARFTVTGNETAWAEVLGRAVNFAYPFSDDPVARIATQRLAALPGLALQEWQPGLFATVSFDDRATSRDVAKFVDGILGVLLGCGEEYPVDAEIVRL